MVKREKAFRTASEFANLRLPRQIGELARLVTAIETVWSDPTRCASLHEILRSYLRTLAGSGNCQLASLSRLAEKLELGRGIQHFLAMTAPIERLSGSSRRDGDWELSVEDRPANHALPPPAWPLYLLAENIRSAFNVGSLLRTAECLAVSCVYLCGYTATPAHPKVRQTSMGVEDFVHWEWSAHCRTVIQELRDQGVCILGLETLAAGKTIYDWRATGPTALLIGNERHGLTSDTLRLCDEVLCIPVHGHKNSLNVGVAFAVAAYALGPRT